MTSDKERLAERVRMLLARLDVTQDELAELLGVRRQAVSGWLNGTFAPQKRRMAQFELLERRVAESPTAGDVEAVYNEGADELRRWLRTYTTRALHAQAAEFGQRAAKAELRPVVIAEGRAVQTITDHLAKGTPLTGAQKGKAPQGRPKRHPKAG